MKFLRLDKKRGSGAPVGGKYAYLICVSDIDYFPPTDEKGVRLDGDIVLKPDTSMMPVYISNSSKEYAYDTIGNDDEKSYLVKFSGTHPGTELEALEFAKNKLEESYIILIPGCSKDEPWKVLGEILNPLIFTSSHKAGSAGSKFTFNFEQRIGSEYIYFLYGGTLSQPAEPGENPSLPGSGFDPRKWARIDASNIDEHIQAWREKLVLSDYKEKSEDNWKKLEFSKGTIFSIPFSDVRQCFFLNAKGAANGNQTVLTSVVFSEESNRAFVFRFYNNSNEEIQILESSSDALSKGFSNINTPTTLKSKYTLYGVFDPETNLIDILKLSNDGGLVALNLADVFTGDGAENALDIKEASTEQRGTMSAAHYSKVENLNPALFATQSELDAEIVNRAAADNNLQSQVNSINSQKSSVVDKMLHYWDSLSSKWLSAGIYYLSGKIGIGNNSPSEVLDVTGRTRANSFVASASIGTPVPYEIGFKDGAFGYSDSSGVFKAIAVFEHQIRGKRIDSTISGSYNLNLNSGSFFALIATSSTSISFINMIAVDESTVINLSISGSLCTFPSWLVSDPYNDVPDVSKTRKYTIVIEKGGTSPQGVITIKNM